MSKSHMLALFTDFDEASASIRELKVSNIQGFNLKDVTLKSPIEHPEIEELLGDRPVYVQFFTLFGALFGGIGGFAFISSCQATFLLQPKGGKPVIPIPPDMVLTYELFILFGVYITVLGFFIGAKLPMKRHKLYNARVSEDQIGILIKAEDTAMPAIKDLFTRHKVLEIIGEGGK
ncbi:MAG: DUF3341 domain-containing protein [Burkholderiales bacterium]|nr:DUF3341 domain-containing protein [Burkholderiales bacterium]